MRFSRRHRAQRLLVKHVQGEADRDEEAEVRAGISVDKEKAILLQEFQQIWDVFEPAEDEIDLDAAWTSWLDKRQREAQVTYLPNSHRPPRRGGSRHLSVAVPHVLRVAAVLAVAIVLTLPVILLVERQPAPQEEPMQVFATGRGQRTTVQLHDGTRVVLNANTEITVSKNFGVHERTVYLQGEAYFEVTSGLPLPFIVRADDVAVEVHGTKFNVRAYASEVTEVLVAEGVVSVAPDAASPHADTLHQAQMATIVGGEAQIQRDGVNLADHLAWVTGGLVFKGAPFQEVQRELERRYDIEIQLRGSPRTIIPLDATFQGESLSEILNIIASALDLDYTRDRQQVVFFPRSIHS